MSAKLLFQSLSIIFSLLAGWAWIKSVMLQLRPDRVTGWLDSLLNRISRESPVWNAIAAFLVIVAAVARAVAYLIEARATGH
jgi:hypothetical protein